MNRGSSVAFLDLDVRVNASMRPRFMNRGSATLLRTTGSPSDRFNEAPIHESGKSRHRTAPSRMSGSFNEAPIHESGKSVVPRG